MTDLPVRWGKWGAILVMGDDLEMGDEGLIPFYGLC